MPCMSSHGGGRNVPQATDLILPGECPQASHLPHESDALQNICGAEVGQERKLIQWQGGNCVGMGPAPHARARRVLIRR